VVWNEPDASAIGVYCPRARIMSRQREPDGNLVDFYTRPPWPSRPANYHLPEMLSAREKAGHGPCGLSVVLAPRSKLLEHSRCGAADGRIGV
jgi:hypothetical protein